jgi:molybdopterin-containing oxidoreductase family iron-sulfur binding subunit
LPFTSFNGANIDYHVSNITVTDEKRKEKIAQTQTHNSYEDRFEVVRETSLATFKKDPDFIVHYRDKLAGDFAKKTQDYRSEATLYPMHPQPGIKWE